MFSGTDRAGAKGPRRHPQVKGVAFRSIMRCLENLHGEATVGATLQKLPPCIAEGFRYGTITATAWYPIEWYRELFRAIVAATGDSERVVRKLGRESAKFDLGGVYSVAFKLVSPQAVLELSTRLFSNYYDTGTVRIVESRPGFVLAHWSNCVGFDRNLWLEVISACEEYLELAGAKNVRCHVTTGGGSEDTHMDAQAHWT